MSRPTTTIVLITRHLILRTDFARGNALVGRWSQARPDGLELPVLVEIALGLGPKPGKTVYLLSSDFWTQTLQLNHAMNMGPADLAAALNFEAEALSGLSAFEASVGYQPLPGGNSYWLVQVRSGDLSQADEIIRKAGSRLGGVGHPGAVPRFMRPATSASTFVRIEFWPDAVLFLRGGNLAPPYVQVLNADAQMGRWRPDWDQWRQNLESGETQALVAPGINMPAVNATHVFALDDHDKLAAWLAAWAECLTGKMPAVPLVRPARQPLSVERRRAASLGLAALILLGCWLLHMFLVGTLASIQADIRRAQEPTQKLAEIQKQIQGQEAEQKRLQTQAESLDKALDVLGTQRQRLTTLLATLAKHYPEHLFVEKIDTEGGEPCLFGRCLEPELADQFASKLTQALLPHGWEVQAPKKHAETILTNGCPWTFEIAFKSTWGMTLDTGLETKKGNLPSPPLPKGGTVGIPPPLTKGGPGGG